MSEKNKKTEHPPPPSLPEPVTTVFGAKTRVSSATIEHASLAEAPDQGDHWLRQLAEVRFVTSQEFITVAELRREPRFSHIRLAEFKRWAAEDTWLEKRREYFESLKRQLEQKIGNALVRSRYEQLRDMDELSEAMKTKLRQNIVEPKSYEGMVKALLGVEEFRRSERVLLASDVIPESVDGEGVAINQVVPDLSDEEARTLAAEIMKLRQEKIRDRLRTNNEDTEEPGNGEKVDKEG